MTDFVAARRMMVDGQIRTSDVTDRRVIAAMLEIPRERFLPPGTASLAYVDLDAPVGESGRGADRRRLMKPMVLAKLLQAAEIGGGEHVLDVGCASGYSAAILAQLAGTVVALEEDFALAAQASVNLRALGAANVTVERAPLTEGWPGRAPYDVILLDGASEVTPKALLRQLKEGGRLVGVLGRPPTGKAMLYRAFGQEVSGREIFDAAAPVLPGFSRPASFVF